MEAVARRAAGKAGRQGRRPSLKVGARTAYRVGIDDHTSVAKGDMLIARRRLNGLVIDARISHDNAQFHEGGNGALFEIEHRRGLSQESGLGKISSSRVCDS